MYLGAFHHAKDSGNFGRNSNAVKDPFWFLLTGKLQVVHLFPIVYSDQAIPGPVKRKMSFHFPGVFPLISDRSAWAWHNGKHP